MVQKTKKFFFLSPIFAFLIVAILLLSFGSKVLAQNDSKAFLKSESPRKLRTIIQHRFRPACGSGQNSVHCFAKIVTLDDGVTPLASSTPSPSSLSPLQFHLSYQLPCQPGGIVSGTCSTPSQFGPQTIAIVDAYHTPNIENDLNIYSNYFGIAQCTKANGCLTVVNQNGGSSLPSRVDSGWAMETSLDVEVAHAICQTCKILLVEANSNTYSDLASGVNTAASLGATSISNSYGGSDSFSEKNYDAFYNHPGIAVTASAGDSGYGAEYPASSPYVVGVGGTTLNLYTDNSYSSESVWSGTGSGCSSYENANSWQMGLSDWGQTGCAGKRGVSDISAVADPNTGAAVYDSTPYSGQSGWWQVGGTSLSSPIIAGTFALAGGVAQNTQAGQDLYANYNSLNFHDITVGSNGICGTIMCAAGLGFDGPTGLGTPNGLGGFGLLSSITPTPTSTPTPTLTPTLTPIPTLTLTPAPTLTPTPTPVDTQAPTVSITSPLNGSTVRHGYNITISATASDNVGVSKVEFYVNSLLLSTDTTSPYRSSWRVPYPRNVQYVITAKAYDTSGNSSTTSITVTSR